MPAVAERRKLAPCFQGRAVSVSRACELLGISRRRLGYSSKKNDTALIDRLKELARAHPRMGGVR